MDINAAGGSKAGASDAKIAALPAYRTSPLFSDAERVALELADAATGTPHEVSDDLFARARSHYTDAALVELASIIALENFRSRLNRTFRVEAQGFYCVLPSHGAAAR